MTDLVPAAQRRNFAAAVRAQYGAKASEEELQVFALAAQHLRLSIPAGEIALVPYGNENNIQITLEGRRTIAQRTGRLRGIAGPEWCGPRRYDGDGNKLPLDWEEVWTGDGLPYCARCLVLVDGWDTPANGTAKYSEFNQPASPVWKKYPSHMLGNAAEKLALRRGFSAEIGKALADLAEITGQYIADDDTGEIAEPAAAPTNPPGAAGQVGPAKDSAPKAGPTLTREEIERRRQLAMNSRGASRPITVTEPESTSDPIPAHVHDNTPESRGAVEHAYRYDPDDSGRPF